MGKQKLLVLLIITVGFSSCFKDDYDFQNVSIENYNPTIAVPLVNTTMTLEEVLENVDTTLISTDDNNLLQITFSDSILSYNVSELISIPSQNVNEEFNLEPIILNDLNNSASITLGDVAGNIGEPESSTILNNDGNNLPFPAVPSQSAGTYNMATFSDFNSLTFSQGNLNMTIENNWPIDLTNITIEIRNNGNNALIGSFNFPFIPAGSSSTDNVSLVGVTMENSVRADIVSIESPGTGTTPVLIELASTLEISVSTSNIEVVSGSAIVPDQEIITQTMDVNVNMTNGEELNTLRLNDGSVDYSINYGLRENAQVTIVLPFATNGGVPLTEVINITSDHINPQTVNGSISLAGYEFDLTAGGSESNYIPVEISASMVSSGLVIPFDTSDAVIADLSIGNLDIDFLDGYLGNLIETIGPDTISLSFFQNDLTNSISVADPQMNLRLNSSIGIPVSGDLSQLFSYNDQGLIQLSGIPNPTIVNYPTYGNFNSSEITDISLDGMNSNIADIFNSAPDGFIYNMEIETNPDGNTGELNFITDESKIDVTIDVTVPIYGAVSGYEIIDTLEFPYEVFDNIKEGIIRTNIDNEFPVDVAVQVYFTDENYNIIDSLFSVEENVVLSSSIDANGELVSSTEKMTDFNFSEDKVNTIRDARYVIIGTNLSTANGGNENAKFYSHYELTLKLGIKSTVQFNIQL